MTWCTLSLHLCLAFVGVCAVGLDGPVALEDSLRARLHSAADSLGQARAAAPVQCECKDYCQGRCFAAGCAACPASTWSFPGGEDLCVNAGPLGTGLLCRVGNDQVVTQSACCGTGIPCALPSGSCCQSGSCSTCPSFPADKELFSKLNESNVDPRLQRHFDSKTNTCSSLRKGSVLV